MVIWLSIFVIYFIFLLLLISGLSRWRKMQNKSIHQPKVSVVVAMRNEALNLPTLISSLANQTYSGKWELILVDDQSEDNTTQAASILKHQYANLSIRQHASAGSGKKQALTTGVENATGEIILTTDADCEVPPHWIYDLVKSFQDTTQLVVGTVSLNTDSTFFTKLQAVEFASVMATTLGMLGWNKPVMCNGASLAFKRSAFIKVQGYSGNEHIPSGDDEFLMRKIASAFPNSIQTVNFGSNSCQTKPVKSIGDFFEQRIRWAGKWQANTSWLAKSVALFVFLFQLAWLPVVAISLFTQSPLLLMAVFIKIMLEFLVLFYASISIQQKFSLLAFLVLQIVYSPYVILVALASQLVGYKWKGRTVMASR
jgi:poly-beta-1,6-N-acetyl-D-glucosamine synthase